MNFSKAAISGVALGFLCLAAVVVQGVAQPDHVKKEPPEFDREASLRAQQERFRKAEIYPTSPITKILRLKHVEPGIAESALNDLLNDGKLDSVGIVGGHKIVFTGPLNGIEEAVRLVDALDVPHPQL